MFQYVGPSSAGSNGNWFHVTLMLSVSGKGDRQFQRQQIKGSETLKPFFNLSDPLIPDSLIPDSLIHEVKL